MHNTPFEILSVDIIVSLSVWVIMVVVVALVAVVVIVVIKVPVWAGAIINIVVVVLTDVEIIVVVVIVIVFKFALLVPYSADVSLDVVVDLDMCTLADVMLGVLTGIGIGVLADAEANTFAGAMTASDFPLSTSLEEFSSWAAFDCWPLAFLDCGRVLQARIPSYHV